MPLYRAFALISVKVKDTFRKYAIGTGDEVNPESWTQLNGSQ